MIFLLNVPGFLIEHLDNTSSIDIITYSTDSDTSTIFIQGQLESGFKIIRIFIFMNAIIYF